MMNYKLFIYILFAAFSLIPAAKADDTDKLALSDKRLIAEYLERFTRFIEWPDKTSFYKPNKQFIIGVYGANPFGDVLEKSFSKMTIKERNVSVKYINDIKKIGGCHLLFITGIEKTELKNLLKSLKGRPILTVSHTSGFAESGVHINLYFSQNKLQFEINDSAVRRSGLKMSYLLLLQAKLVKN